MALSPQQIFDALTMTSGQRGRGEALRRGHRTANNSSSLPPAQQALVDQLRTAPARERTPAPLHPEQAATELNLREGRSRTTRPSEAASQDQPVELTPADLMWLQRLPQDPAETSFEDATRLANLAGSMSAMSPSSQMLLRSIWEPVKLIHDERVARHALATAPGPVQVGDTPAATRALQEAVAAAHPDFTESQVAAHVRELVNDFDDAQHDQAARTRSQRQADLDAVMARKADRVRTSHQVAR